MVVLSSLWVPVDGRRGESRTAQLTRGALASISTATLESVWARVIRPAGRHWSPNSCSRQGRGVIPYEHVSA